MKICSAAHTIFFQVEHCNCQFWSHSCWCSLEISWLNIWPGFNMSWRIFYGRLLTDTHRILTSTFLCHCALYREDIDRNHTNPSEDRNHKCTDDRLLVTLWERESARERERWDSWKVFHNFYYVINQCFLK